MKYIVGYGRFNIIREQTGEPFRIYWRDTGKLASYGSFWTFAAAREECDIIRRERRDVLR